MTTLAMTFTKFFTLHLTNVTPSHITLAFFLIYILLIFLLIYIFRERVINSTRGTLEEISVQVCVFLSC